ncbi:hypothetical protein ElyMa_005962800 [Elysia marginata]|uniref:Uncharacterized protein n=1 Tax=Elysia marginata TaxID=1093978 RepID=A0AAV4GCL9_9GAST|nr:hypothetical protein ElyMa_005962800 [Elysia marginata]
MANDGSTGLRSALSAGSDAIRRLTRSKSRHRPGSVKSSSTPPSKHRAKNKSISSGNVCGSGDISQDGGGSARAARNRSSSLFRCSGKRGSSKSAGSFSGYSAAAAITPGAREANKCQDFGKGDAPMARDRRHTVSVSKQQQEQQQLQIQQQQLQQQQPVVIPTTESIRQLMDPDQVSPPPNIRRHHSVPRRVQQHQQQRPTLRHLAQDVVMLATNGILATPPASMFRTAAGDSQSPSSMSPAGSPYSDRHLAMGFRVSPKTSPKSSKRGFYGSPSLSSPKIRRGSPKHSPKMRRGSPKCSPKTVKAGLSLTLSVPGENKNK